MHSAIQTLSIVLAIISVDILLSGIFSRLQRIHQELQISNMAHEKQYIYQEPDGAVNTTQCDEHTAQANDEYEPSCEVVCVGDQNYYTPTLVRKRSYTTPTNQLAGENLAQTQSSSHKQQGALQPANCATPALETQREHHEERKNGKTNSLNHNANIQSCSANPTEQTFCKTPGNEQKHSKSEHRHKKKHKK